jgi:hypothetical protein
MSDFDKKISESRFEGLATFDLDAIAIADDQKQIIGDDGSPILTNNRYNLELKIKFGYISRISGGQKYDFGIKKAIMQVTCDNCKMPWKDQELWPNLYIEYESKDVQKKGFKFQLDSKAIGISFGGDTETTKNIKIPIVWIESNDDTQLKVHFRAENNIIFAKTKAPLLLGTLEILNQPSYLRATLFSVEVIPTQFNNREIKSNLGLLIQRFTSKDR